MKLYRKKGATPMRPYIPGEDMSGISVLDQETLIPGGMIAENPENPADKWYVGKDYFEANYESAE